ncbi:hypothetical protein GOC37_32590, partial [Sinorhizobium meliloti]|nr:hypothetical protein [Sinorhizobium meliloti]
TGGEIIPETGGAIISEQRGGFIGIGTLVLSLRRQRPRSGTAAIIIRCVR